MSMTCDDDVVHPDGVDGVLDDGEDVGVCWVDLAVRVLYVAKSKQRVEEKEEQVRYGEKEGKREGGKKGEGRRIRV